MRKLTDQQLEERDRLTELYHCKLEEAAQARSKNESAGVDVLQEEAVELARQDAEITGRTFDEPRVRKNIAEKIHERAEALRTQ
jgi:benzoyl-CoA reductase/2-hydroxyglutaryl-CoA dehydratase subunit BcrC/BadD/HgdB